MEPARAIPPHIGQQVKMQTPGGTPIGDIVISQKQTLADLRMIADDIERELQEELNNSRKSPSPKENTEDGHQRKKGSQKDKKRKRNEEANEENTENDSKLKISDGEKIFMETRTGRSHYLQVIKEMEYIKGIPSVVLLSKMVEWVLGCEIKRQRSRNSNGSVARQMREYLIKLYCTIDEIQKQKDKTEAGKLKKQIDDMRRGMVALQEENKKLRVELEQIKSSVSQSKTVDREEEIRKAQRIIGTQNKNGKGKEKDKGTDKEGENHNKESLQPNVIVTESREGHIKTRRELRYSTGSRGSTRSHEVDQNRRTGKGNASGQKKRTDRLNSVDQSAKKRRKGITAEENQRNQPEMWTKVLGRRERMQEKNKTEAPRRKEKVEEKQKKRRPLKTSAVVITVGDSNTLYVEVLAWAR